MNFLCVKELEGAKALLQAKLDGQDLSKSGTVNAGVLHAMSLIAQVKSYSSLSTIILNFCNHCLPIDFHMFMVGIREI